MNKFIYVTILIVNFTFNIELCLSQWQPVGPSGGTVYSVCASGQKLIAGTEGSIFKSTDNGETWALINNGIPSISEVWGVYIDDVNLYICGYRYTYKSTNDGQSWIGIDSGQSHTNDYNYGFTKLGNNLYLANAQYIYKSIDTGSHWFPVYSGESFCVYTFNNNLYAGGGNGILISTNNGVNWTNYEISGGYYANTITSAGTILFTGFQFGGVFKSTNYGTNWIAVNNGLPTAPVYSLTSVNNIVYAGLADSGLYRSTNLGSSWEKIPGSFNNKATIYSLTFSGNNVYAGIKNSGIFKSTDDGISWIEKNNGLCARYCRAITSSGTKLFATSNYNTIYSSTNYGSNWTVSNSGIPENITGSSIMKSGTNLFLGTNNKGVYLSTDDGNSWVARNSGIQSYPVNSIINSSGKLLITINNQGVWTSTNQGLNWTYSSSGLQSTQVTDLVLHNGKIFIGTWPGLQMSTNNGESWVMTSVTGTVGKIFSDGSRLFVTTPGAVQISSDNGTSWQYIQMPYSSGSYYNGIYADGQKIILAGSKNVYFSDNGGANWIDKSEGLSGVRSIQDLYINNNYVYICTYYNSVWRRMLSEIIGVINISTEIPSGYKLFQNYPNPFNPSTVIRFQIKDSKFTTLKVYDILGKEMVTLVNENLKPGTYEVTFNGSNLPSGIYFYQLKTDNFIETKKLILIK